MKHALFRVIVRVRNQSGSISPALVTGPAGGRGHTGHRAPLNL